MLKSNIDQLMKRYVANEVTQEERERIEAWLDTLKDDNVTDLDLTDDEGELLYQKIVSKEENIEAIKSFKPNSLKRLKRKAWTLRIAAGILIVISLGFVLFRMSNTSTDVNSRKITFADGTIVWTKGGTSVSFEQFESERNATLEGDALFEVAKNPQKPFIITSGDLTFRVVGTSFSLKTGQKVELQVLTGHVAVSKTGSNEILEVNAHEMLTYSGSGELVKKAIFTEQIKDIIAGTEYDMSFAKASLKEVIMRLEAKFDVSFALSNPAIGNCHLVNFDITDNSLELSLEKIAAILHVEYKIEGNTITLSGSGCN